jgi:hypothetical protein
MRLAGLRERIHHEGAKSTKRFFRIRALRFFMPRLPETAADSRDWTADYFLWLPLACLSWGLAWKFQDVFITDWDGFDYAAYTVRHLPSALGLGRAMFLGYNYLLWEIAHRAFGVEPASAYLVIRYGVMAQTGFAILGMYALAKELTANRMAASLAALIVAASPYFILYSGRGMSEIPGFLMLSWSLWWMLRSLRLGKKAQFLLAAFSIGLSANVREFAIFYLPFIPIAALLFGMKWRMSLAALLMAVAAALTGMAFWASYDTGNYLAAVIIWYKLSAQERKLHPVTLANLRLFADYSFNCSVIVTLLTPAALFWRGALRPHSALFWLGATGLFGDLLLIANHDLSVNPRYLLIGLFGLAPLCGWCLAKLLSEQGIRSLPLLFGLLVLTKGAYNHMARELYNQQWSANAARKYLQKIEYLPWNSGFIVGARTPLVHFLTGVGAHPYWRTISPGATWPHNKLDEEIQEFFYAGREVYIDFDPELWQGGARENSRVFADLYMVKQKYQLKQIHSSFYRVINRLPE